MKTVIVIVTLCIAAIYGAHLSMPDYKDHPCQRRCVNGSAPMVCEYNFTTEWYHTLSKACYHCPVNLTDCGRPHCAAADGFFRSIAAVNRMLPGPAIQVCEGDMVVVNVLNRFETAETTVIHWHGIHQRGFQYMDGVPGLTQCPIDPLSIFTYRFEASPSGTHYWHAHSGLQRGDGVFGALVVRVPPENDPHFRNKLYDKDLADHVIILNDWTHQLTIQKFSSHHHAGDDNKPKGLLINGMGSRVNVTIEGETALTPQAVFSVQKGHRYRFRVISNAVLNCPFQISVDQHDLLVIASDGRPLEPYLTQNLVIYGGERYDVVIHTNQTAGNYWLKVAGLADCDDRFQSAGQAAVIHYDTAQDPAHDPLTNYTKLLPPQSDEGKVLNPFNKQGSDQYVPIDRMRSLPDHEPDPALRPEPDYRFFFGMDFMKIDNKYFNDPELYPLRAIRKGMQLYTPQMNNISNSLPASPILSQLQDVDHSEFCSHSLLSGVTGCPHQYCYCTQRHSVQLGSVVEVIVVDEGVTFDASHPMHLHGYAFRVIGMEKIGKNVNINEVKRRQKEGKLRRNLVNPPRKDTVIVPDGGYVIIRFHADNPGEWFFHCHLLFHSELGMGVVFNVGQQSDLPPVPPRFPRCGNYRPQYQYASSAGAPSSVLSLLAAFLLLLR